MEVSSAQCTLARSSTWLLLGQTIHNPYSRSIHAQAAQWLATSLWSVPGHWIQYVPIINQIPYICPWIIY